LTTEFLLFILRIASALLLLALLSALFWIMWRDVRAATETSSTRRTYGRLSRVYELEQGYVATGEYYPLLPLTSLGRSPTNSVPLDDTFASSDHAVVALRNGRWWLEDRQSTNGTLLNKIPIDQAVIITDGDIISIGQTHYRLDLER
jgi:hypothetical protein